MPRQTFLCQIILELNVGGSSVKVPGFKQNMITNVGGNYITDDGLNVGLNANLQPNEYGKIEV